MSKISWAGQTIDVKSTNPNTSIQKEIMRTDDGTCIGQKHNITIKGYFYAEGDPINKERQADLYVKMIELFNKESDQGVSLQQGLLEILPDSNSVNLTNTIRYKDAKLLSISLPEPPDETAGIQYQEYSISFEAHQPKQDIFDAYKISSVSESWNIKRSTEFMIFTLDDISSANSKYAYEIEHTISAVGINKFNADGVITPTTGAAWYQAWNYVNEKIAAEGANDAANTFIDKDNFLEDSVSSYDIGKWKPLNGTSNVATALTDYSSYNRVRSSSIDIAAGSYSVSTTFIMSNEPYVFDITCQFSQDEQGAVSLTVEGTCFGLSSKVVTSNENDKITQSRLAYDAISGNGSWGTSSKGYSLALNVYNKYYNSAGKCIGGLTLDDYARSISVTENKNTGTIQFNALYKALSSYVYNLKKQFTGAISATLNITDDNKKGSGAVDNSVQTVAIIPIIGRKMGPVIQNMGTTKERVRSASIEIILSEACRNPDASPGSGAITEILKYSPASKLGATTTCYIQDYREEWDWTVGRFQGSLQWVYQV